MAGTGERFGGLTEFVAPALQQARRIPRRGQRAALDIARAGLGLVVRTLDDRQLTVLGSNDAVISTVLGVLATVTAARDPELDARIQFDLRISGVVHPWTVAVRGGRGSARPRTVETPDLTLRLDVADLLRLAAAQTDGMQLVVDGRLAIDGEGAVALALLRAAGRPRSSAIEEVARDR